MRFPSLIISSKCQFGHYHLSPLSVLVTLLVETRKISATNRSHRRLLNRLSALTLPTFSLL